MLQDQTDTIGVMTGKAATYGGGASAFLFGLSASEFAAIVGATVAVLGYLTQLYFNRRRERRESDEHAARMAQYRRQRNAVE